MGGYGLDGVRAKIKRFGKGETVVIGCDDNGNIVTTMRLAQSSPR